MGADRYVYIGPVLECIPKGKRRAIDSLVGDTFSPIGTEGETTFLIPNQKPIGILLNGREDERHISFFPCPEDDIAQLQERYRSEIELLRKHFAVCASWGVHQYLT